MPPPTVTNSIATSINPTNAILNGNLTSNGGETTRVAFYWGTIDGGTSAGNWDEYIPMGETNVGSFSHVIVCLTPKTTYYYRCHASNWDGDDWANATVSFTTPPAVPRVTNNGGANPIHSTSATLNGEVASTGGENPTVHIYWGDHDSGAGSLFRGIWGSSATDVFAVGYGDTILHYNGSEWSKMDSPAAAYPHGIWGSSATDVFAVGYGDTILHYNGNERNEWSAMTSPTTDTLWGICGSSATDVFAVGDNGTILHYYPGWRSFFKNFFAGEGGEIILRYLDWEWWLGRWSAMTSHTTDALYAVWGSSATDVFAVGDNGTILHYDWVWRRWRMLGRWSEMTSHTTDALLAVWGSSATDVFAVGDNGTILHYDGNERNEWSAMTRRPTTDPLWGVWGSSATDVFAVGVGGVILHYNGNARNEWSAMTSHTTNPLFGVWGSSATDVFAVGENGTILHYDGREWGVMALWEHCEDLGNRSVGTFSRDISGLAPNTRYYYRCYASNSAGADWANATASFTIPPAAPTVTNASGADPIHSTSATLNGEVASTGGENPTVRVYWGTSDGGTTPGNWDNDEDLGPQPAGVFSHLISGLTPNTRYYYRCYASNSYGPDWADSTTSFDTPPPPLSITTTSLPNGTVGTAYSETLQATGGTPPYNWSISAGFWPTGLSLDPLTGIISGTPSVTDTFTFSFTAMVKDSVEATATRDLSITIFASIVVISPSKLIGADDATGTNQTSGAFILTRFQAVASGTMNQFRLKSGAPGNVKCALYADNAGEPGDLITAMDTEQAVTGSGWETLNFTPTTIVNGTYYWLAICHDTNGAVQWISGGAMFWKSATYSGFIFPNLAGSGFTSGAYSELVAGWGIP